MNRSELVMRVRSLTRDFSASIFRQQDILDFLNEAIDRCKQIMKELESMVALYGDSDVPTHLPNQYHSLLAVYAAARCYAQDERHYQAQTYMNEFEAKMDELKVLVDEGRVVIKNPDGSTVDNANQSFYVEDNYFFKNGSLRVEPFDLPDDEDLGGV